VGRQQPPTASVDLVNIVELPVALLERSRAACKAGPSGPNAGQGSGSGSEGAAELRIRGRGCGGPCAGGRAVRRAGVVKLVDRVRARGKCCPPSRQPRSRSKPWEPHPDKPPNNRPKGLASASEQLTSTLTLPGLFPFYLDLTPFYAFARPNECASPGCDSFVTPHPSHQPLTRALAIARLNQLAHPAKPRSNMRLSSCMVALTGLAQLAAAANSLML